jgi:hypothetical protein
MSEPIITSGICPRCGYEFDAASAADDEAVPEVGDVTICLRCAQPMVFTSSGPQGLSEEDVDNLDREQRRALVHAIVTQCRVDPLGWWAERGDGLR